MQYRVKLYDNLGGSSLKTFSDAVVAGWSKRINAPGRASFWLPARSKKYTSADLQKYRRIRIERKRRDSSGIWDPVWYGYIEAHRRMDADRIGVVCQGMLNIFTKRFCTVDQAFTLGGSVVAEALVSAANSIGNTGLIFGTGGVVTARPVTMQGRIDMLRAMEMIAAADGAEFEVSDEGRLNFVPLLGTNKTHATLRFRRDGKPGTNLRDTLEGEDGAPLVNRLHVSSTNGGIYTANDAVSQGIYGVLEGFKRINEAQDGPALAAMGDSMVSQLANPATDFQVIPLLEEKKLDTETNQREVSGMAYGDLVVGDLITAEIHTENQTIEEARRIAEIDVNVDQNEAETVRYTLSKSGVFVTGAYLSLDEVAQLRRKIQEIEGVLS